MIDITSNILVPKSNNELINNIEKVDNKSTSSDTSEQNNQKINGNENSNNSITNDVAGNYYRAINDTTKFNSFENQKDEQNSDKKEINDKELTKEEKEKVKELKARDNEVKTHEQAHVNAGASNAQYEYEVGPDGAKYAVGGHADIETSEAANPEATLQKAQKIKKAALAPSNPSGQDRKVAAEAETMASDARKEIREENINKLNPTNETENNYNNQINTNTKTDKNEQIESIIKGYGNSKFSASFIGRNININA